MNADEESLSLVCYTEGLSSKVDLGKGRVDVSKGDSKDKPSLWQRMKRTFISETFQCISASGILIFIIGCIVISFFYCKECLFGIMVISACMCPFLPYYNIPLWISILLVTIMGINYVHRDFTFIWK